MTKGTPASRHAKATANPSMSSATTPGYWSSRCRASAVRSFLAFLAIVSISLGVLNLLPIPVLDGGQIVYQIVEMIKGSPMTERAQILGQQAGILALLLLMSFAFYNDIARILS